MPTREAQLLAAFRIGRDTSMCGRGLSLRDALARSEYARLTVVLERLDGQEQRSA